VLGARLKIVGDVSGDEDLVVNGKLEGKIRVDRKVTVNAGAEVEGDVQAKSVTIGGRVHGQVMASERAELLSTGRVQGNVHAAWPLDEAARVAVELAGTRSSRRAALRPEQVNREPVADRPL